MLAYHWASYHCYHCQFFLSQELLGGVNNIYLTFILEKNNPILFIDFRPLSIYKIFYYFISKIIINLLVQVLHNNIDTNQHAFLKYCIIYINIILCHETIHNYHLNWAYKTYDSIWCDAMNFKSFMTLISLLYLLGLFLLQYNRRYIGHSLSSF